MLLERNEVNAADYVFSGLGVLLFSLLTMYGFKISTRTGILLIAVGTLAFSERLLAERFRDQYKPIGDIVFLLLCTAILVWCFVLLRKNRKGRG